MPKHSFSLADKAAAIRAALASKRTPHQFRRALRRQLRQLEIQLKKPANKRVRSPKFLGWLKL